MPRGRALTSPIVRNGVTNRYDMALRTGLVSLATMDRFEVDEPVVLDSVEPLRLDPGLELLAVRVNFVVKHGVHGFRGFPGVFCKDHWPPKRFVELHEPGGLKLGRNDQVAVTFFVRSRRPGDHTVAGVRIRYRENGFLQEQTTESNSLTVLARDSDEELRPTARCRPDVPSQWFGEAEPEPTSHTHDEDGDEPHSH